MGGKGALEENEIKKDDPDSAFKHEYIAFNRNGDINI